MFTDTKRPTTNEDRFEEDYQALINEIEYRISQVVREEIEKAHTKVGDGLKFLTGDKLDVAIHNYILRGRYNPSNACSSNIEIVLETVDDQKSYY